MQIFSRVSYPLVLYIDYELSMNHRIRISSYSPSMVRHGTVDHFSRYDVMSQIGTNIFVECQQLTMIHFSYIQIKKGSSLVIDDNKQEQIKE